MNSFEGLGLLPGQSLLIKDSLASPAGFIIPQFLRMVLKDDVKVVLVLVKESLSHYQHVLRKLGISLQQCIDKGQIIVIDLLMQGGGTDGGLLETRQAFQQAVQTAEKRDDGRKICLVVDDFTELHSLHCSAASKNWTDFVLRVTLLEDEVQASPSLVTLVHEDVPGDAPWIQILEHHCQVTVRINELDSGRSNEVTGQVHLNRRHCHLPLRENLSPDTGSRCMHLYKLTDTGLALIQDQRLLL